MRTMILSVWDDFSKWVSVDWSETTYIIIMCALGILAMMGILAFFKGDKYHKEQKPFKWATLVGCIICLGLIALFSAARFT